MGVEGTPPVVVVGASAGGVEALREFVGHLPADFPGCVLVVLHMPPTAASALPRILARSGSLPVRGASEGAPLEPGTILVGVPDQHLVVLPDSVTLTRGPTENGHRPAIDVLFRSAARHHAGRVTAVVLSGSLDDGAAGMVAVRCRGGHGIVQDFDEAPYAGMPAAAAAAATVEVLPIARIPARLVEVMAAAPDPPADNAAGLIARETDVSDLDPDELHDPERPGTPAGLGCPSCGGALFQIDEATLVRFRCRVGHAWSPESLLEQQTLALESALWRAIRSLEEKVALATDLADRAKGRGSLHSAARFAGTASDAKGAAEVVRRLVDTLGAEGTPLPGTEERAVDEG